MRIAIPIRHRKGRNGNHGCCLITPDAGPDLAEVIDDVQVGETNAWPEMAKDEGLRKQMASVSKPVHQQNLTPNDFLLGEDTITERLCSLAGFASPGDTMSRLAGGASRQ